MNSSVDIIIQLIQLTLLVVPDLLGCGCAHHILDSELLISENDIIPFISWLLSYSVLCSFFCLVLLDPKFQTRSDLQPVSGVLLSKGACLSFSLIYMHDVLSRLHDVFDFNYSSLLASYISRPHFGDAMNDYVHLSRCNRWLINTCSKKRVEIPPLHLIHFDNCVVRFL